MALWVPRCWTQCFLKPPADSDRQLTTDECWSTLLPVDVRYRWMLWFADAVYRAPWFAFSTFCRVQTSIDIAGSLFLPWKPVCKATQMLNFLLWLELHVTCTVCLPPIAYNIIHWFSQTKPANDSVRWTFSDMEIGWNWPEVHCNWCHHAWCGQDPSYSVKTWEDSTVESVEFNRSSYCCSYCCSNCCS